MQRNFFTHHPNKMVGYSSRGRLLQNQTMTVIYSGWATLFFIFRYMNFIEYMKGQEVARQEPEALLLFELVSLFNIASQFQSNDFGQSDVGEMSQIIRRQPHRSHQFYLFESKEKLRKSFLNTVFNGATLLLSFVAFLDNLFSTMQPDDNPDDVRFIMSFLLVATNLYSLTKTYYKDFDSTRFESPAFR